MNVKKLLGKALKPRQRIRLTPNRYRGTAWNQIDEMENGNNTEETKNKNANERRKR